MPLEITRDSDSIGAMTIFVSHLLERLDTLNRVLTEIEDRLRGIEQRMSYATVLDSDD